MQYHSKILKIVKLTKKNVNHLVFFGHPLSGWIPDISAVTGYLAGYRISGRMLDIWPDTGYLTGYQIFGRIRIQDI